MKDYRSARSLKGLMTVFLTFVVVELLPSTPPVVGAGVGVIVCQISHHLVERALAAVTSSVLVVFAIFFVHIISGYGRNRGVNRTGVIKQS